MMPLYQCKNCGESIQSLWGWCSVECLQQLVDKPPKAVIIEETERNTLKGKWKMKIEVVAKIDPIKPVSVWPEKLDIGHYLVREHGKTDIKMCTVARRYGEVIVIFTDKDGYCTHSDERYLRDNYSLEEKVKATFTFNFN